MTTMREVGTYSPASMDSDKCMMLETCCALFWFGLVGLAPVNDGAWGDD